MPDLYIIGDIHGCCKTFKYLVQKKIRLKKSDTLFCLGDYIDRGPDSKGVIDFIVELRKKGFHVRTLRGNHEQMLLDSYTGIDPFSFWMGNGGEATLESFGIESIFQLNTRYLDFFKETEIYIATDDFILVHAGLNFRATNPLEDVESMLWIRGYKVDRNYLGKRVLIHGHTPVTGDFIRSQKTEGVVNLDGGCVYKSKEGLGNLFALDFTTGKFLEVKNID